MYYVESRHLCVAMNSATLRSLTHRSRTSAPFTVVRSKHQKKAHVEHVDSLDRRVQLLGAEMCAQLSHVVLDNYLLMPRDSCRSNQTQISSSRTRTKSEASAAAAAAPPCITPIADTKDTHPECIDPAVMSQLQPLQLDLSAHYGSHAVRRGRGKELGISLPPSSSAGGGGGRRSVWRRCRMRELWCPRCCVRRRTGLTVQWLFVPAAPSKDTEAGRSDSLGRDAVSCARATRTLTRAGRNKDKHETMVCVRCYMNSPRALVLSPCEGSGGNDDDCGVREEKDGVMATGKTWCAAAPRACMASVAPPARGACDTSEETAAGRTNRAAMKYVCADDVTRRVPTPLSLVPSYVLRSRHRGRRQKKRRATTSQAADARRRVSGGTVRTVRDSTRDSECVDMMNNNTTTDSAVSRLRTGAIPPAAALVKSLSSIGQANSSTTPAASAAMAEVLPKVSRRVAGRHTGGGGVDAAHVPRKDTVKRGTAATRCDHVAPDDVRAARRGGGVTGTNSETLGAKNSRRSMTPTALPVKKVKKTGDVYDIMSSLGI